MCAGFFYCDNAIAKCLAKALFFFKNNQRDVLDIEILVLPLSYNGKSTFKIYYTYYLSYNFCTKLVGFFIYK